MPADIPAWPTKDTHAVVCRLKDEQTDKNGVSSCVIKRCRTTSSTAGKSSHGTRLLQVLYPFAPIERRCIPLGEVYHCAWKPTSHIQKPGRNSTLCS